MQQETSLTLVISGEMVETAIKSGKVEMLHDNHNQRKEGNSKKKEGESQAIFHKNQASSSYAPQPNYSYHNPYYYPIVNNIPQPSYYSSPRPMNK